MQIPTWTKPALIGAGVGAVALAIIGFSWGGWTTLGNAQAMAKKESTAAVADALVPYCIDRSQKDPNAASVLAEFKEAPSYSRRSIIEDAGWATPLGAEQPNRALAIECQDALAESVNS